MKKTHKIVVAIVITLLFLPVTLYIEKFVWDSQSPEPTNEHVKKTVNKKIEKEEPRFNYSLVTPEQFGAKGDGNNDDTSAFTMAVEGLGDDGGTLLLKSGKTYKISDTIKTNADIAMISSDKDEKAKIYMDSSSSSKPVLDFSGKVKYTTTIKENIKYGDTTLNIEDTIGIEPNDLILIESNKPWYYDPRIGYGDLHKGELHRVRGKKGTTVLLDHPVWDSYSTIQEDISVKIIKPIKVTIQNIEIERKDSKSSTIGVTLTYGIDSLISNVVVKEATSVGIYIKSNYRTTVENSNISGANYISTGYGIQTYGSTLSLIRDNEVSGSRRGIDVSGKYPDNSSTIEFNVISGGGENSQGEEYINGDLQYGIGTHSTANFTVFRGNVIRNVNYGINIRSKNVTISKNNFIGYFKGTAILLAYGRNATITENKITPGIQLPKITKEYKLPKDLPHEQANAFLYIRRSYDFDEGKIIIKNNNIKNLTSYFIRFIPDSESKTSTINHLEIINNKIGFNPTDNNQKTYFIDSDFDITTKTSKTNGNQIDRPQNYVAYRNFTFKPK